jgi:hypothetical protein
MASSSPMNAARSDSSCRPRGQGSDCGERGIVSAACRRRRNHCCASTCCALSASHCPQQPRRPRPAIPAGSGAAAAVRRPCPSLRARAPHLQVHVKRAIEAARPAGADTVPLHRRARCRLRGGRGGGEAGRPGCGRTHAAAGHKNCWRHLAACGMVAAAGRHAACIRGRALLPTQQCAAFMALPSFSSCSFPPLVHLDCWVIAQAQEVRCCEVQCAPAPRGKEGTAARKRIHSRISMLQWGKRGLWIWRRLQQQGRAVRAGPCASCALPAPCCRAAAAAPLPLPTPTPLPGARTCPRR